MSAEELPYQLRPNKFIDRQMFVDLLTRFVPFVGADRYVYISMGGKHLVDHAAVYRYVGIENLFSFDQNEEIIGRQEINRPISKALCKSLTSGNLAGELERIVGGFPGASNVIVWLDYTSPHERRTQLQELTSVAGKMVAGDIIRVTLNANLGTLDGDGGSSAWKLAGFKSPQDYRIERLRGQIGEYVPNGRTSIEERSFPSILCECVGLALSKVERLRPDIKFTPVLNTSYRDGQRMTTVTCLVEDSGGKEDAPWRSSGCWSLAPTQWGDIVDISAPDLSIREKIKLDEIISDATENISQRLGFLLGESKEKSLEAVASYKTLHRYYPSFHNVDR